MAAPTTLEDYVSGWAHHDVLKNAVASTILNLSGAGIEIARIIQRGPLSGDLAGIRSYQNGGGDAQKELDVVANDCVKAALRASPVAWLGSEEDAGPVCLNDGAPLVVNTDPLDGSSNIETNVSVGTIFSILPAHGEAPLLQRGREQLCAGYIMYGPQTAVVLSVGTGTHIFWLDPQSRTFVLGRSNIAIPERNREFAVNASNSRHWRPEIQRYVGDCLLGADGPFQADYNMRWVGSLVADAFRILTRGGIFLYPSDARKGYEHGRIRLLYEANPVAMLIEQAGGSATTGAARVLDVEATSLHQREALIFGSKADVDDLQQYFAA